MIQRNQLDHFDKLMIRAPAKLTFMINKIMENNKIREFNARLLD